MTSGKKIFENILNFGTMNLGEIFVVNTVYLLKTQFVTKT